MSARRTYPARQSARKFRSWIANAAIDHQSASYPSGWALLRPPRGQAGEPRAPFHGAQRGHRAPVRVRAADLAFGPKLPRTAKRSRCDDRAARREPGHHDPNPIWTLMPEGTEGLRHGQRKRLFFPTGPDCDTLSGGRRLMSDGAALRADQ